MRGRDLPATRTGRIVVPGGVTIHPEARHVWFDAPECRAAMWFHRLDLDGPPSALEPWMAAWGEHHAGKGVEKMHFWWESTTPTPVTLSGFRCSTYRSLVCRALRTAPVPGGARRLVPADREALVALMLHTREGVDEAYTTWARWYAEGLLGNTQKGGALWGLFAEERLVSTACVIWSREEARFQNVMTHAAHRGRGHCTGLVRACLSDCASAGVERAWIVTDEGSDAERLYQRLGFELRTHGQLLSIPAS